MAVLLNPEIFTPSPSQEQVAKPAYSALVLGYLLFPSSLGNLEESEWLQLLYLPLRVSYGQPILGQDWSAGTSQCQQDPQTSTSTQDAVDFLLRWFGEARLPSSLYLERERIP